MKLHVLFAAFILIAAALLSSSQPPPREQVGPLADGGFLLNSGWRVKPAGTQIPLDTLPMSSVLSKDGRFLMVLNGGYNPPSLSVLDTKDGHEIGRTPVADAWLGLALSPNGTTLWVGGGSQASVYEFSFDENGKLTPSADVRNRQRRGAVGARFHRRCRRRAGWPSALRLRSVSRRDRGGEYAIGHRDRSIQDRTAAVSHSVQSRRQIVLRDQLGRWLAVSSPDQQRRAGADSAAGRASHRHGLAGPRHSRRRRRRTGEAAQQPSFKARIFVSAANTNNVYSVGVSDSGDLRVVETINVSTTPNHPLGMTPSALALSPDQSRLYVVCSDANAAAVVDVTEARSQVLGFVPTGWYPTAATRAGRWPPGGAERQGIAQLSESRTDPIQPSDRTT